MADDPKTAALTPAKEGALAPAAQPNDEEDPVVDNGHAEVIETWFRDHFAGSSALAATTEAYNAAYAAKEDLKKRLTR